MYKTLYNPLLFFMYMCNKSKKKYKVFNPVFVRRMFFNFQGNLSKRIFLEMSFKIPLTVLIKVLLYFAYFFLHICSCVASS